VVWPASGKPIYVSARPGTKSPPPGPSVQSVAPERSESGPERSAGSGAAVQDIAQQQLIATNSWSNQTPPQIFVGTSFAQRSLDESDREMAKGMT